MYDVILVDSLRISCNQSENDPEVANIFALSVDGTASGDICISDRGNWICWFTTLAWTELRFPEKSWKDFKIRMGFIIKLLWLLEIFRQHDHWLLKFSPFFLFHLHRILLLPIAYWPAGHFSMQVAAEHSSSSPASNPCAVVGVPQFCQSAAAFTPTGNPQSPDRCFAIWRASKYDGWTHSAVTASGTRVDNNFWILKILYLR